jgi:predicted DNA-binding transcriptional regulator AlpA
VGSKPVASDGDRLILVRDLVTAQEIADRLGVAGKAVYSWWYRYETFPDPVKPLVRGNIWSWEDVTAWVDAHRHHLRLPS